MVRTSLARAGNVRTSITVTRDVNGVQEELVFTPHTMSAHYQLHFLEVALTHKYGPI